MGGDWEAESVAEGLRGFFLGGCGAGLFAGSEDAEASSATAESSVLGGAVTGCLTRARCSPSLEDVPRDSVDVCPEGAGID